MPLIKSSKRIVWSTLTIDKSMPFGKICSGNCRKLHEDLTKVCNKCREYMSNYIWKNRDVLLEKRRARYALKSDKVREAYAALPQEKKDEMSAKCMIRYEKNRDEIREKENAYYNTRVGKLKKIKGNAKDGHKDITMTDEEIMDMTDMPCVYCGKETIDAVKRNGIDRLDSSIGYVLDNCVSCCQMCNMMKGQVDPWSFVERCAHISYINGGSGDITEHWTQVSKRTYGKYKNQVIKAGNVFELTKEEFENIRLQDCKYCQRSTTTTHCNGIDRVEPKVGYILSNCVPCCRDCNIMKASFSVDEFISQVIIIARKEHTFPAIPRCFTTFTSFIKLRKFTDEEFLEANTRLNGKIPLLAAEFDVSSCTIKEHRKRLGLSRPWKKLDTKKQ
ncbi:hypothetical protein PBCVNW6652_293R [Paramecium bursaria Chlorella virus NW665.2]|nr:hypothetical protein PBCVNW6652_293R [Paramecium bursaria Chlorella virus NW665.2]